MSLKIQFYLADGSIHEFEQDAAEGKEKILTALQRGKVFSQSSLIISSRQSVTALSPALINRLDVIMANDEAPQWLLDFDHDAPQVQKWEISPEQLYEFVQLQENNLLGSENDPMIIFEDIQLMGGGRCCIEVRLPVRMEEMQQEGTHGQRQHLHNAFSVPHFACRRLGGGVSIINPAQIVRYDFYPGLEPPTNAWPAEPVV